MVRRKEGWAYHHSPGPQQTSFFFSPCEYIKEPSILKGPFDTHIGKMRHHDDQMRKTDLAVISFYGTSKRLHEKGCNNILAHERKDIVSVQ